MKQTRLFYDIAHGFESVEAPHARVRRALELLREIVPYDRCALLEAQPGRDRRLVIAPPPATAEDAALQRRLDEMLALFSEHHEPDAAPVEAGGEWAACLYSAHLTVPLVGLDQVIGLLFVGRAGPPYEELDLCRLSVVAAQVATYLTMLRLHEERNEFVAALSHELRTPLTAVLGWAEMLLAGGPAKPGRAAEAIARNANMLGRLIEDVIDLSRITTGKLQLALAPVDAEQIVEAAVEAARPKAAGKSIQLESVASSRRGSAALVADAQRLEQIVSNLLTNAVKFTPNGGRIDVSVDHEPDQVSIRVSDTGIGIPPDLLPRIFDRYQQGAPTSKRGEDGLGLGLSIVRNLVELHGGRITAESPGVGKGAQFTVTLPCTPAAA